MTKPFPSRLAALLHALRDPAAEVDRQGSVVAWNAAAEAGLGIAAGEAVGRRLDELALPPGAAAGALRLPLDGAAGEDAHLLLWPARDPGGTPEEALLLAQKAGALGRLAAGVAHDLSNPLGSVLAFAHLLRDDERVPEDLRADTELVRDAAERTHRLVRALLELARSRPPAVQPVDVGRLLREVLDLEAYLLVEVELDVDLPEDLPEVECDPGRLRQALVALTLDAIEALGGRRAAGGLRVAARTVPGTRAGVSGHVEIEVADTAPPVPDAERPGLFRPVPGAGIPGPARGGLDLAVARRLLEADGGTLRHEAGTPTGNRFVATLPLEAPASGADSPAARRADPATDAHGGRARAGGAGGDGSPGALTVLVCDDEASVRLLVARVLERAGMRVLEAASGEEALALAASEAVDVLVADHQMTPMSGTELGAALAARHPAIGRRVILMSGDPGNRELLEVAAERGLAVLPKPFDVAGLTAAVREAAER